MQFLSNKVNQVNKNKGKGDFFIEFWDNIVSMNNEQVITDKDVDNEDVREGNSVT